MYYTIMKTHMCDIILVGDEDGLTNLHLNTLKGKRTFEIDKEWTYNEEFFSEVIEELEMYFRGELNTFSIKLNPRGTDYQKKVWNELSKIEFNEVLTYKDLAIRVGNPNASRAVGMANSKNPIPIIVPCHRVIGSSGKLTGFAHGLEIKEKLINFEKMSEIYNKLKDYYGNLKWWPASSVYEMMVGAILTQNTTWVNVEKALSSIGDKLKPESILSMDNEELAKYIRSSGYYNQKAIKIKALTEWYKTYDFDIKKAMKKDSSELRDELLDIHGVGKETADCILVYALGKPSFVIDTYTRRMFKRLGFSVPSDYDEFREMFENALEKDLDLYNKYHGLIVKHSKEYCMKSPNCDGCPVYDLCERDIQLI